MVSSWESWCSSLGARIPHAMLASMSMPSHLVALGEIASAAARFEHTGGQLCMRCMCCAFSTRQTALGGSVFAAT
eukprot:1158226-Pelagomonas_calceolata.AAC.5